MKFGAVALIDALGFRGIWGRHRPEDVLRALREMKDLMEARIQKQFATQTNFQCASAFLSDTIALSVSLDESTPNRPAMSAVYLCDVISWVLDITLRSSIPLAFRGAVAIGEYEMFSNFLIGPAIDEAAAAHEQAQGAIIFLTPEARLHVARWLEPQPQNTHLVRFEVPLKSGDRFESYTVSPLEQAKDANDANRLSEQLLSTFARTLEVAIKRQHTERHLQSCYAWRRFSFPSNLSCSDGGSPGGPRPSDVARPT